jgi:AmiR/NasT family two-component response regulator/DNA-binding CsgD family transcriptional regulator
MSNNTETERHLRIAVAEDQPDMRAYYQTVLPTLGHQVIGAVENGLELVEFCATHQPDLVIADIAMPKMDGIEAAARICDDKPVAIVLVSAHYDRRLLQRAKLEYIMAYLVKPITEIDLEVAIPLAMTRFEQFEVLRQESHSSRQAMSDRRVIEQAKAIVMQATDLSEDEAFSRLQKTAWQQKQRVAEVAQQVVASSAITSAAAPMTAAEEPPLAGEPLTDKELEVIQLVARSMRNVDIAKRLNLRADVVQTHSMRAMRKLGLRDRAELITFAEKQAWQAGK